MRKALRYLFFCMGIAFLLSGCGLLNKGYQEDKKAEQEILGSSDESSLRIREVKYCLQMAGFEPGSNEGKLDPETRKAIKKFQKYNNLNVTGYVGLETWEKLKAYQQPELTVEPLSEPFQAAREESSTKNANKEQISLREVKSRLKSAEWIKKIQEALRNAGFDPGAIDGKIGMLTKEAVRKFQEAVGLKSDGLIGPKTWAELSLYFPKSTDESGP